MTGENSDGEPDSGSPEKDTSAADSGDRESIDEVPEYEGQWAALSDGESSNADGDSGADESSDE